MRKIAIWTVGAVLLLISGIFYSPAGATPLVGALSKLAITSSSILTQAAAECGKESGDAQFCEDGNVLTCSKGASANEPVCTCVPCPPGGAHCPCPPGRTCNIGAKWYKC